MEVEFVVIGVPVAKGRARSARLKSGITIHYTPTKTVNFEKMVASDAKKAMHGKELLTGPLHLDITFYMPIPKSWAKKKKAAALNNEIFPVTKPDCSNLQKGCEDAMNEIVYHDDSQIVDVHILKLYGATPCSEIRVLEFDHIALRSIV